jgi:pimeloyl-ACP methyl ester carboxylesterase
MNNTRRAREVISEARDLLGGNGVLLDFHVVRHLADLGASMALADPFERQLNPRGLQTITFDAPGVGEPTPYLSPRRMRGAARTVARMAAALGYDRMDVLGVSLGGVVAQQLAHQSPDLVHRLVLAATGPGLGGVPGSPRVLLALATPAATTSRTTTAASRRAYTAAWPAPTPTRCCPARSLGRAAQPAWLLRPALRDLRLDQPALAANTSPTDPRAGRRRRPDRSARQRAGYSPAASPRPGYTSSTAAATCSSWNARPRWPLFD